MALDLSTLPRDRFGDTPQLQDELAALVCSGRKVASCGAVNRDSAPQVGMLSLIEDSRGRPRCVIETLRVETRRFADVDEDFARAEGEGDLSLAYWRDAHRAYFERNGGFHPDMMLWCETFCVVQLIDA